MDLNEKREISTRADVELMVRVFYSGISEDPELAPVFAGIDLSAHLPVIADFWSSVLLDEHSYKGNAFDKHLRLQLSEALFKRWLDLFEATVDDLFTGDKAGLAKQRANSIAFIFKTKLKHMGLLKDGLENG